MRDVKEKETEITKKQQQQNTKINEQKMTTNTTFTCKRL